MKRYVGYFVCVLIVMMGIVLSGCVGGGGGGGYYSGGGVGGGGGGGGGVTAPSGSLDTTFGPNRNGKVTTDIGTDKDIARAIAIQPDGKIVVAGWSYDGTNFDSVIVRYNPDGSLDRSFGIDGIVKTNSLSIADLAIQGDGKIVVAGTSFLNPSTIYDFVIVRYNPDGSLDPTFGTNGIVTTDIGTIIGGGRTTQDLAYALAIQSDGKIVVAGYSDDDFAIVRYDANGNLDPTFGTNGIVTTDIGTGTHDLAHAIAIYPPGTQGAGKIVVAGFSYDGTNYDFAIVRYNADGSLDTSFGRNGIVTTDIGTGTHDEVYAIAIQSDGKIVVVGESVNDSVIVRYNPDGSIDRSFGIDGIVKINSLDLATALAIQPDGKIVVAGWSYNGTDNDFAVVRYNPDGSIDTSFGTGGIVTTDIGTNSEDKAYALGIQQDGKIVVAGYSNTDFALVRYWP